MIRQLELALFPRALCKIHGMLVIAEFNIKEGKPGEVMTCPMPNCDSQRSFEKGADGWTTCYDCNFSMLTHDLEKILEAER